MSETWRPFWRNLPWLNNFKFPPPSYVNIPSSRLPCYFSSVSFQGVPFHFLHHNHIHNWDNVFQGIPRCTNKFKMPISGTETLKAWKWCLLTFVRPQAPLLNGYQEHLSAREFSIILQIWHLGRSTTFCLTPSPSPSRLDSFSPSLRFSMSITKAKGKKLSGHNHPLSNFFFNLSLIFPAVKYFVVT